MIYRTAMIKHNVGNLFHALSFPGLDDDGSPKRVYIWGIRKDVALTLLLHNGITNL